MLVVDQTQPVQVGRFLLTQMLRIVVPEVDRSLSLAEMVRAMRDLFSVPNAFPFAIATDGITLPTMPSRGKGIESNVPLEYWRFKTSPYDPCASPADFLEMARTLGLRLDPYAQAAAYMAAYAGKIEPFDLFASFPSITVWRVEGGRIARAVYHRCMGTEQLEVDCHGFPVTDDIMLVGVPS